MILDLYETHIRVANFERSRHFYEDLLGLKVGWIDENQRRLLYWVGPPGKAMLGVREASGTEVVQQHFAFEVRLEDMTNTVSFLKDRGIKCYNRIDGAEYPQVFGWMPAVAIYFNDPDGHLLEFISMLPDKARPEIDLVSWPDWNRLNGRSAH
ncbi:MAG TPA: VOC family protein [Lacipirellulaceae bacterium]|jgi:catechol 2,3-dioxygenase-like lactoylglutathione lyase family enzyme|nr:VOC family protein [Lacipirellulaceae bacterium]